MWPGLRPPVVAALAAALMLSVACGRSESPGPTAIPVPPDPQDILRRSGEAMQGLQSLHYRLGHESGKTEFLPGFAIDQAEADIISPDKISMSFSGVYVEAFAVRGSIITIGDESYMTNPLTGGWESVDADITPLGFFSPTRGIASMLSSVQRARLLEDEGEGQTVYRIGGEVEVEALAPLLGQTLEDSTARVELTIDSVSLYLLQARVMGRVTPADDEDSVRVVTLSAFNEPITIEAPL